MSSRPRKKKVGSSASFPVVGLGASAGGLEALEQFFRNVPAACNLGFVVVQHLDPTHKGILAELLQRSTAMPVLQVKDRTRVEPNHVYVIPPNKDLSILRGVLHLLKPAEPRGLRLPIDFFFRALAQDQNDNSIGVILSGMGSDGTLGVRAIKERGGAVFVQTPASAKFDSMPRMAMDDGLADVVSDAEDLPGKILEYLRHVPSFARSDKEATQKDEGALEKAVLLLRAQTGNDFSLYKKSTIYRRIERRMGLHRLSRIGDYVKYLRENPHEANLLFKELLIGVTSFFRDSAVWKQLSDRVLPEYLATLANGTALRAWSVGCSTGEEAYSLAMVFKEALGKLKSPKNCSLQIFATDLDADAIGKARNGVYPANISADVSDERLHRFFIQNEQGHYVVKKEIREMVIFAPQNLVMHPPFTRLDFIICRNLLIYLDAALQKKLMPLFQYSLKPGGLLLLGSSETIGNANNLFSPLLGKLRLYRKKETPRLSALAEFPSAFASARFDAFGTLASQPGAQPPAPSLQSLADQILLQRFSPAAVLVTADGDILYVSGKTGKYLEPAVGKANLNLFAMCRDGLGSALSEGFHRAVRQKMDVTLRGLEVGTNGGTLVVDITVQPVTDHEELRGMFMVVFTDVIRIAAKKLPPVTRPRERHTREFVALREELHQAYEDLKSTRDEMQTSQEELKSTNEELQSMNEELQSTNEELTTSKEEMQSMNEELQTINNELQTKVDELSRTSNDMKNLLNSTDIATLFLDEALLIRRFTTQTASIIKLIPGDVGRPITDIVTSLDYPGLAADAHAVLKTLVFVEKQVAAADGRWFTVRIMPYRTHDNRIDGVVITFADITVSKNLEAALLQAKSDLEAQLRRQNVEPAPKHSRSETRQPHKPTPEGKRPPEPDHTPEKKL